MPLNTAPTVSSAGQGSDVELDLRAIGAAIGANLVWIVAVTLAAFLGAAVFVNVVTPRYSAEARIVIENQQTSLTRHAGPAGQGAETAPPIDQEAVQSQVQIIQSRDIARAVIRDLDLTKVAEFDPMVDGRSPVTVVLALLGIVRDVSQMTAEERALEAYYQRLSAYPVDRSRVIEIRFQSKDPDRAAQIANAIAERFIAMQAGARLERDRRARQHVLRTIEDLRQAVSTAENKVQEYRSRFDLLTGTSNQTLGIQTVSELNTQLSAAQTQRADAQARATSIRAMLRANRPIESSEVLGSPVIQRLTEQRAALKAEIAQQATILLPGHPRMRELNAQLSDNDAQIRAQAERIARGLENDAQIAGEREAQLRRAFEEQKRRTAAQGDQEVTLRALEREAKAQRDLLESWLGLYRESAARDSPDARTAEARIVSLATPSNTPAWPNKLPTVLIVTLAALSLMLVLTVTRELISGRAFTSERGEAEPMERAEPWLPAPADRVPEAAAPAAGETHTEHVADTPSTAIPTVWLDAIADARRILVSSALAGSAADTALAVARALAATERRTVLVEADRNGRLPAYASWAGLSDLLSGRASVGEALHRDPLTRLHVLPFGTAPDAVSDDTLAGTELATLLAALDATYAHIVVCAPSLIESDIAPALAATADCVMLVGEAGDVSTAAATAFELSGARSVQTIAPAPVGEGAPVRLAA